MEKPISLENFANKKVSRDTGVPQVFFDLEKVIKITDTNPLEAVRAYIKVMSRLDELGLYETSWAVGIYLHLRNEQEQATWIQRLVKRIFNLR